jgi:hypothetical protein
VLTCRGGGDGSCMRGAGEAEAGAVLTCRGGGGGSCMRGAGSSSASPWDSERTSSGVSLMGAGLC